AAVDANGYQGGEKSKPCHCFSSLRSRKITRFCLRAIGLGRPLARRAFRSDSQTNAGMEEQKPRQAAGAASYLRRGPALGVGTRTVAARFPTLDRVVAGGGGA